MYAVRCVNVRKIYKQGDEDVIGLDGVSLEVKKGGFVCLRSPSGGGKTTLLNVMGGLDRPDSGEVLVAGKRIDNLSKGQLAHIRLHQIGFVFQAYNLIPVLTAREKRRVRHAGPRVYRRPNGGDVPLRSSQKSVSQGWRIGGRQKCRAVSSRESLSREPSCRTPLSCWPTNQRRT